MNNINAELAALIEKFVAKQDFNEAELTNSIQEQINAAKAKKDAEEKAKNTIKTKRMEAIAAILNYLTALGITTDESNISEFETAFSSVADITEEYIKTLERSKVKINGKELNLAQKFVYFLNNYFSYIN